MTKGNKKINTLISCATNKSLVEALEWSVKNGGNWNYCAENDLLNALKVFQEKYRQDSKL